MCGVALCFECSDLLDATTKSFVCLTLDVYLLLNMCVHTAVNKHVCVNSCVYNECKRW